MLIIIKIKLTPEQAESGAKLLADRGIIVPLGTASEIFKTLLDQAEIIIACRA